MGHGAAGLRTLPEPVMSKSSHSFVVDDPTTAATIEPARPTSIGARHQAVGRHATGRIFSRRRTPGWWRPVMVAYSLVVIVSIVIVKLGLISAASQSRSEPLRFARWRLLDVQHRAGSSVQRR